MTNIINSTIQKSPIHLTTNTLVMIAIAIAGFYIILKVITGFIRMIITVVVVIFILMAIQSTNIINIPVINQAYTTIEKYIPSKDLWTKASDYIDKAKKSNKIYNDLNNK